jgi:hypothetical protein
MRIEFGLSDGFEGYPTPRAFRDLKHPAPVRGEVRNSAQVFPVANDRQLFKALRINANLTRQSRERVGRAFNFKSVKMAIDHSDIDNDVGVCEAQFIDDYGVGTGMKPLQLLLVQGGAYLWVGAHLSAALEHTGRFQSLSVRVPYLREIAKLKIILILSYAP